MFCGAGGLSLGLREAGFSVLVGADADEMAVETHTANSGGLGWVGDLADPDDLLEHLDGWGIDSVELVAGGVPCQPFSRAGRSRLRELARSGMRMNVDPRAELWRSFMAVVKRLRPKAVLVENVPDLPAWDDGAVFAGFLESLGDLGYTVDARVLDCFRFGVPQHRARLILVALADGRELQWPEPTDELISLRDAIGDLPPVPGGQRSETLPYRPRPNLRASDYQRRMRKDMPLGERGLIHDHITRSVRPDDWEAFTLLAPGQTYADMPVHLQRYRADIFTDKYKRLSWDELSRTITAHISKDGYWYIHPEQHRTLSIREAARLQTFPDSFRFAGQPSHRFTQIGNAVPPVLGEVIGRALKAALVAESDPVIPRALVRDALLEWHSGRTHPAQWRRPGVSPWQVLIGELLFGRARDEAYEIFAEVVKSAPTANAAVAGGEQLISELRASGLSSTGARRLMSAACGLAELFAGDVPETDLELQLVPGVGDGVASAVLCFGHGRHVVLLNAATARIAGRVHGRDGGKGQRRWQTRLDLHRLAAPVGPDADFNRAVLDLATDVCRPVRPRCAECPLQPGCETGRQFQIQALAVTNSENT
jgi:DNA (cytosine-5)-methyltransferase 1